MILVLAALISAFLQTSLANPVVIQDASFDNRSLNSGAFSTTLTPWQETGGTANGGGYVERVSGFAADGQNHLGMNLNHNVWQDLGVTYLPNTRYTLTVAVGNRSSTFTHAANDSRYHLAASDGTIFATGSINASTIRLGSFADAPPLVFETGARSPASGAVIRILLQARGSGRSHFDQIRLSAVSTRPPLATTLPATSVTDIGATLNGTVNARGAATVVSFEYGPTTAYGSTLRGEPAMALGSAETPVAANLAGLPAGTTYHYRVVAANDAGTILGADQTFVTEIPAYLSGLTVSEGVLKPSFSANTTDYALQVPGTTASIRITGATQEPGATLRVQGEEVASGTASAPIPLEVGTTGINVGVKAAGASFEKIYRISVVRPPASFIFASPDTPAIKTTGFDATGLSIDLALGFAPDPGTSLKVVEVTGRDFIVGEFANLAQGQPVDITHGGVAYPFFADYFGGSGNDLVLRWANTRALAWGDNRFNQLGLGHSQSRSSPVAVTDTGVLAGKTILAVAAGETHSLALCADGSLAAWGNDSYGQLGDDPAEFRQVLPVAVDRSGVLAGARVIAIAAGNRHNLALCADGTVVAWGDNSEGQLGRNDLSRSGVPVEVDRSGVLAGRKVVAIAAGDGHNLALCADGSIAAWGRNSLAQLGSAITGTQRMPVLVIQTGVLAGKNVVAVAAGRDHSMALCSDGSIASWGSNGFGQLGTGGTPSGAPPQLVAPSIVLAGKSVTAIAAGSLSSYALCSDGTLASWGANNGGANSTNLPAAITKPAALASRTIVKIGARATHAFVVCSDGTAFLWGSNLNGELGTGNLVSSSVPVAPAQGILRAGERFLSLASNPAGTHNVAIGASMPAPSVITHAAGLMIGDQSAELRGSVGANGSATDVVFEYGTTHFYGSSVVAAPARVTGTAETQVTAPLTGLLPGTTYHFRVVANSPGGTRFGAGKTFTTTTTAALAGLTTDAGALEPGFQTAVARYSLTVPFTTESLRLTPVVAMPGATVLVNGVACASGSASAPVPLAAGNNSVPVVVTPADGSSSFTYTVTVTRLPARFTFGARGAIGAQATAFTVAGMDASFELGHAPQPGDSLTVLDNTGMDRIRGEFADLAQGQIAMIEHGGITYPFVVNYFGGTGNDLVLEWANTRVMAWGANTYGQLGTGDKVDRLVPAPMSSGGPLAGKRVSAVHNGADFSIALCHDGSLFAWGFNSRGQLGHNRSVAQSEIPVQVDATGVLAGKRVVAVATGDEHCLALCADGTLVAWGDNQYGQLGIGSTQRSLMPVEVNRSGVLAGREVIAIASGHDHSLALCSDGTLAAWGRREGLGDGSGSDSNVPVEVDRTGALLGKRVIAISAGYNFSIVLCEDGTLAAWGANGSGEYGNGDPTAYDVPVRAGVGGALTGKTVTHIVAGGSHVLALCSDGTLAAWGENSSGMLGNNSQNSSSIPVAVVGTGALSRKKVVAISAGESHSMVRASDGTLITWGWNYYGTLGNGITTNSPVPVAVSTTALNPGERFGQGRPACGARHSAALVSIPVPPIAETLAATAVSDRRATLQARVHPNGAATTVSFEYGLTTDYGASIPIGSGPISGNGSSAANATPEGLLTNTTYHYRVVVTNANGTWRGEDMTFTTSGFSTLAGLTSSQGEWVPAFTPVTTRYSLTLPNVTDQITFTPVAAFPGGSITINGTLVGSGTASAPLDLAEGPNRFDIISATADGMDSQTYTVTVTRLPQRLRFTQSGEPPLDVANLDAAGSTLTFDLAFHPPAGTDLTAIRQVGLDPIRGTFDNLTQGQRLVLTFEGIGYEFAADYFGGDGSNDLVLRWANTRIFGWGANSQYQLGHISTVNDSLLPIPALASELLAHRAISALATGSQHSLVLCTDGTLGAMGSNTSGQLGDPKITARTAVPTEVDRTGVLAGRTVVAIAAGANHSLALCSDGTLAAWGAGTNGNLGNNTTTQSNVPVGVDQSGVLAGRRVVAIAAGTNHNLALCQDGTVVAWGLNDKGQLGDGSLTDSPVPVAVNSGGVLLGKKVIAVTAGGSHSMVLCEDGMIATWGDNSDGQLGNDDTVNSLVPVAVVRGGLLAGKTVTKVLAGLRHNFALCSDGTLAGWGTNESGRLGTAGANNVPLPVVAAGALTGKTIIQAVAANRHSLALCSDNSAAAWGAATSGELGNNNRTISSFTPVAVRLDNLRPGERFTTLASGPNSRFSLALAGSVQPPAAITQAATDLTDRDATLRATVFPNGTPATVSFEYGPTPKYGTTVVANPATLSGTGGHAVSAELSGLTTGITYHFRVRVTHATGTSVGSDMTFTTTMLAALADLSVGGTGIVPGFDPNRTHYAATVPFTTSGISVTPVAAHAAARIKVNGTPQDSGVPSPAISLAPGTNGIEVMVESADGAFAITYQITVTRMPEELLWISPDSVPLSSQGFIAAGNAPVLKLGHVPRAGNALTLVNNTGADLIHGAFDNLAPGQKVMLDFDGVSYPYFVNYQGGDGNDLVLEWGNAWLVGWGANAWGELGNGSTQRTRVPTPADASGVLAGRAIRMVAAGDGYTVAVCMDGTLVAFGRNDFGQLGNGTTVNSDLPVEVNTGGVLAGKTVVAIQPTFRTCYVLCSDHTLVRWGANDITGGNDLAPVVMQPAGALLGKQIIAIAAGYDHLLALLSDGSLATWGENRYGALGNGNTTDSAVPVAVNFSGVLADKRVTKISAGSDYNLALCADGTLVSWGYNHRGQLGNKSTTNSLNPVAVDVTGVLVGKEVVAISAGSDHSLASCADGTLVAWGGGSYGQLGNGTTSSQQTAPVLVDQTGVLAGKVFTAVFAGSACSFVRCDDGALVAWGVNENGQLGDGGLTARTRPGLVDGGSSGAMFMPSLAVSKAGSTLAIVAKPLPPETTTLAADAVTDTSARLNATVRANGTPTLVWFEFGTSDVFGRSSEATPSPISGGVVTLSSAEIKGLQPGRSYFYRVVVENGGGRVAGETMSFTTTTLATLADLAPDAGAFFPAFQPTRLDYTLTVPASVSAIRFTPVAAHPGATITVNGATIADGAASDPITIAGGISVIQVVVTNSDGAFRNTYSVTVTRLPDEFVFNSAEEVPVITPGFTVPGVSASIRLGFAPAAGTSLTLVDNTSTSFIQGRFGNLAHGQRVALEHEGIAYAFIANYYGGTGNDLVLQWANTTPVAWGLNDDGQLGLGDISNRFLPVPAPDLRGVLADKTLLSFAAGRNHTLAICSDGTLAAWGAGRLGNRDLPADGLVPVTVDMTGDLYGKTVIAVAAGDNHSLVLCSDGSMAAWGINNYEQLGATGTTSSNLPTLIESLGALTGKNVISIHSGAFHNLALCDDGTLAAWGYNVQGVLGDGTLFSRAVPVRVGERGILAEKAVIMAAAGASHNLALCDDGTLVSWGRNDQGQLGDGTSDNRRLPVAVDTSGILFGKRIIAIGAGSEFSVVLCADGTLATWGLNSSGQLGIGNTTSTTRPVAVDLSGALAGRKAVSISVSGASVFAMCDDGTVVAWGGNSGGTLGIGEEGTSRLTRPVIVALGTFGRPLAIATHSSASQAFALVASPLLPLLETLAATDISDTTATLRASVRPNGQSATLAFEFGLTEDYGQTIATQPPISEGIDEIPVHAVLNGLVPNTTYHYRAIATTSGGVFRGNDQTFTTGDRSTLAGLVPSSGNLSPTFKGNVFDYAVVVTATTETLSLTAFPTHAEASIKVNGAVVAAGVPSSPIALTTGNTRIRVEVSQPGGAVPLNYAVTVIRIPEAILYLGASAPNFTVDRFTATGPAPEFGIEFAPTPGTDLMVVNNTGYDPIEGAFDNLEQGQPVNLAYNGIIYPFVADYFGGTGNDLVLRWAATRLLAWGHNSGKLGDGSSVSRSVPVDVVSSGVLAGKTVMQMAVGGNTGVAVCSDGTVAAWGTAGQLGNGTVQASTVPVAVDRSGALADRKVIRVAVGESHTLALCSDGTVVSWGSGNYGVLGVPSGTSGLLPVEVDRSGVLAGRKVIAIAAGSRTSYALCQDGTLASWGSNEFGELGIGVFGGGNRNIPVEVNRHGALAGKRVIAIDSMAFHCMALCSDGTLVAWGHNGSGRLGNNSTANSPLPVAVDTTGVLAGNTIRGFAVGSSHSVAWCTDGTIANWGDHFFQQLGGGVSGGAESVVPLLLNPLGALAGKTPATVSAGGNNSFVLSTDGLLAGWGRSDSGSLGTGSSSNSGVPVAVTTTMLRPGERFTAIEGGPRSTLGIVASRPRPFATTAAAGSIADTGAELRGLAMPNGNPITVTFDYGLTTAYGSSAAATPGTLEGTSSADVSASISGLLAGTTYHYRLVCSSEGAISHGEDRTFTTSSGSILSGLTLSAGSLTPAFSPHRTDYLATVPFGVEAIRLTPLASAPGAAIRVNGTAVESGSASALIHLSLGVNPITVTVESGDGTGNQTYSVAVTRLPETFHFSTASSIPLTMTDFAASGDVPNITLGFTPSIGTTLTLVKNVGNNTIAGNFSNLPQWQTVDLSHDGINYRFVANYYGGSGKDLVLQWGTTRLLAWGKIYSDYGQELPNSGINSVVPTSVDQSGVLAGRSVVDMISGRSHSLALCTDGAIIGWGNNASGQLGAPGGGSGEMILVNNTGVLAGRTVIRVAAGYNHSVALCSDGALVTWGSPERGQLGNGSANGSGWSVPVLVNMNGVLAGKTVIAIAAGSNSSYALCTDNTVVAWGYNEFGQLGNGSNLDSNVPVRVDQSGVLSGKTIVSLSAGSTHALALCADGTLVSWGRNQYGQLGDGGPHNLNVPGLVSQSGLLAGRSVVSITAGLNHSACLCEDGTIATWGRNESGQLGNGTGASSNIPVAVVRSNPLIGKTVVAVHSNAFSSRVLALCADGTLAAWGQGPLGDGTTAKSNLPKLSDLSAVAADERAVAVSDGGHVLVRVATPPPPVATTLAATTLLDTAGTLNGSVHANGGSGTTASFEYGLTEAYGSTVVAVPDEVSGTISTNVSARIEGLLPGITYHYRVLATDERGTVMGENMTFTTTTFAALADLSLSRGTLAPGFDQSTPGYTSTVPFATATITLTPVVNVSGATATVAGVAVEPGTPSSPIPLDVGANPIAVKVTTADSATTMTYTVTVIRLPQAFVFNSPADIPLTVADFMADGDASEFVLNFTPQPGSSLMVIQNTGSKPIYGAFSNLTHLQVVELIHGGTTYSFIANYRGGDGNDLVLEWAATRIVGWGNTVTLESALPVNATPNGWFFNNGITQIASGGRHYVVLHFDGTISTWGENNHGQLGDNSFRPSIQQPVNVDRSGVLKGKRVVSVAAGNFHSLALCDDGTLASWGRNFRGQLGTTDDSNNQIVPMAVDMTGVLAGRRVVSITAGPENSFAVCDDGTVAAWGDNYSYQLGTARPEGRYMVPLLVDHSGVLAGKKVIKVAAGGEHTLALCDDGTLATWGRNFRNQLGDNSDTYAEDSPVAVYATGLLAGKTVIDIATGENHCLALCSDGTLAAWGDNSKGQLGDGWTATTAKVPVEVKLPATLAGKSVIAVQAGTNHCLALCSDGAIIAWGDNSVGQLGNGENGPSALSATPIAVNLGNLLPGERVLSVAGNSVHSFGHALTALPGRPHVATLAATTVGDQRATLNAEITNPAGVGGVFFDYGKTTDYSESIAVDPSQRVSTVIDGLVPGTTYHFRIRLRTDLGTFVGEDRTFVTSTNATLQDITMNTGNLFPAFASGTRDYATTLPFGVASVTLTPTATDPAAAIQIAGTSVSSGQPGPAIPLEVGSNPIPIKVTSTSGDIIDYHITVTRLPEAIILETPTSAPLGGALFQAAGDLPPISLRFPPATGAILSLVENAGAAPIQGRFNNLAQGQLVIVEHDGSFHQFIANYHGGDGNDLVLQWANTRLVAWGDNYNGRFGNGSPSGESFVPTEAGIGGALTGKRVIQTYVAQADSLALCSDGTLTGWSRNSFATIGSGYNIPKAVDQTGAFAGKEIAALALRSEFAIALCTDGSLVGWGTAASYGLFPGDRPPSVSSPTLIQPVGELAGRQVSALAMGDQHVLALCADGTLVSWGTDLDGMHPPALVSPLGALAGKRVVAISAGGKHNLALCSDGTVAAWGFNNRGQLGNNTTASSRVPVVVDMNRVLPGGKIVAISAGDEHSLALGDDGTLIAWGYNNLGQLGIGTTVTKLVPVAVDQSGVLAGKAIRQIRAAADFNHVLCDDGTIVGWGGNYSGQLGDGTSAGLSTPITKPVATSDSTLRGGERFMSLALGMPSNHQLALVATPSATATAIRASDITGLSATLHGSARVYGQASTVWVEIGESKNAMIALPSDPAALSRRVTTPVTAAVTGLRPGTTYLYRIVVENEFGTIRSAPGSFTTLSDNAKLALLGTSAGVPAPVFDKEKFDYLISVAHTTDRISIIPVTDHPGAKVRIAGQSVVSGTSSQLLPLVVGANRLSVLITAEDGIHTETYTLVVTRLPEILVLDDGGTPSITADGFHANNLHANLRLGFHPPVGTSLTVVDNTSLAPIYGEFSNLKHGQRIILPFEGVNYAFVANYFGGTGNDLVLHWADTRLAAWGLNNYGQLGNGTTELQRSPVAVDESGPLAGKTIISVASGYLHSLALASDGSLAAWGYNVHGQLGNNGNAASHLPTLVDPSGALAGKTVIAISAGPYHNLALCSDGTIVAWGYNNYGQLGTGDRLTSRSPVIVPPLGALAGKRVISVAAGAYHSLALCADGTIAAWGYNDEGQLGDGTTFRRSVPVAVDHGGALAGRQVAMIRTGQYHTLALCTDGTVVAWGYNPRGQLGNGTTTHQFSPVDITRSGALDGRTVIDLAAGGAHSLARFADGSVAAWGHNHRGQLGSTGSAQSVLPQLITHPVNAHRITAGSFHNLALDPAGVLTAWGDPASGQLGVSDPVPPGTTATPLAAIHPGSRTIEIASGPAASHNLAIIALPIAGAPVTPKSVTDPENTALLRYAFGLAADDAISLRLPQPHLENGRLVTRFTRPPGVIGITYGAEWSTTLLPGSWQEIPNTGSPDAPEFITPATAAPSVFMRLKIIDDGTR